MEFYLQGCGQFIKGKIIRGDFHVKDGAYEPVTSFKSGIPVFSGEGKLLSPSFCDLHTHLREPGFAYKETMKSGTIAAARGGFTTVCAMPNLDPVPDSAASLSVQLALINESAAVEVIPYAAITKEEKGIEVSEIEALAGDSCGFSDDGKGVQSAPVMAEAMRRVTAFGGLIAAHAEDESELKPCGVLHDGPVAAGYSLAGMPSSSEYKQIERDLLLVRETGCRYHVCHVSAKESLKLVKAAKEEGLPVTCEVTPHHLALCELDIAEDSGRFKMNPPLRGLEDKEAILEAIADGTIDVIATDHAPHTEAEKSKGLKSSAFGTVGSETAFAVCNTFLVKAGVISYERLLAMLVDKPREILKRETSDGWVLLDTELKWRVEPQRFLSMGRSTPFEGIVLQGDVIMTAFKNEVLYIRGGFKSEYEAKTAL